MKILVVEDEHRIANSIKKGLEQEHFIADVAYEGKVGYDLALSEEYDLIILDLMLPGIDGLEICRQLRSKQIHIPILILTAKSQIQDRVTGLDTGADDYLTKPFSFEELLARVRALSRRPKNSFSGKLEAVDLTLDTKTFEVYRGNVEIKLSSREFSLLEYLLRSKNKVVTKDQIINHVWNYDSTILVNTVEVYIKKLRKKIDESFPKNPPLIKTVRGFGYKLSA